MLGSALILCARAQGMVVPSLDPPCHHRSPGLIYGPTSLVFFPFFIYRESLNAVVREIIAIKICS